jgi:hypothetical protein
MATETQFCLENDGQSPLSLIIACQKREFEVLRAVVMKLCSLYCHRRNVITGGYVLDRPKWKKPVLLSETKHARNGNILHAYYDATAEDPSMLRKASSDSYRMTDGSLIHVFYPAGLIEGHFVGSTGRYFLFVRGVGEATSRSDGKPRQDYALHY